MVWGRYDRQRMLAIRIAAITLASDSAITIARFRPSKIVAQHYGTALRSVLKTVQGRPLGPENFLFGLFFRSRLEFEVCTYWASWLVSP